MQWAALFVMSLVRPAMGIGHGSIEEHAGQSEATWTYREEWEMYGQCNEKAGGQSPIDIVTGNIDLSDNAGVTQSVAVGPDGAFELEALAMNRAVLEESSLIKTEFVTNKHTWEVVIKQFKGEVPWIEWNNKWYNLIQFHFHSPSENTVNGKHTDMEAHFVHKAQDGSVLVLAVFLKVGAQNSYLSNFWNLFPANTDTAVQGQVTNPYGNFLPGDKSYYYYMGSFTTPPCTTGVTWVVMKTPVEISIEQRDAYRAGVSAVQDNQLRTNVDPPVPGVTLPWDETKGENNRKTQPMEGRKVYYWQAPDQTASRIGWWLLVLGAILLLLLVVAAIYYMVCYKPKKKVQKIANSEYQETKPEQQRLVQYAQPAPYQEVVTAQPMYNPVIQSVRR